MTHALSSRWPAGRLLLVAAGAALGLLLVPPAPGAAQAEDPFPVLAADAPAGAGVVQPCAFEGLVGSARCGVFRVREDRGARGGRTLDIAFVVLEAREREARVEDPIVLLPGGPGQALTPGAVPISRGFEEARRDRDVLLVDVRGVGRSGSLSCDVPNPGGLASRFGTLVPLRLAAACRDTLSRRARLDLYTTASSVDDLDELRAWLGYPSLNLMGTSYGTRVAQVYLRRHPEVVRTVVLNGVAPVSEPLYVRHARLLQRALDRLLAECRADEACHGAYPDLDARLARLLDRFARGPVELRAGEETVPFGMGDVAYAFRGMLYGRAGELPAMIHRASEGDLEPLLSYYLERTGWVGGADGEAGYHFSVLCAEDVAPLTDEIVERETRGTFMGDHLIESYRAVCRIWPHADLPAGHWKAVRSDVPTLLLSGSRDPVTPPEAAEIVQEGLPNSLHVVVPNGGHPVGGACIEAMVVELFRTASVDGLDPSCVEEAPPTRFRLPG